MVCQHLINETTQAVPMLDIDYMCIDIFGIFEILSWACTVSMPSLTDWMPPAYPERIFNSEAAKASLESLGKGVCPNRLWNIAAISPRGKFDVPSIIRMITWDKSLHAEDQGHNTCTAAVCRFNDMNSTFVKQTHKCSGACSETVFAPERLNEAIDNGQPTAWEISGLPPGTLRPKRAYMAISHVWSDGTGIGLKKPGTVNECLFNYFARIGKRLGCDGIWWDTICIPTEKSARRRAIDSMLQNYTSAKCTVVHDHALVNFEWRDDGSPCIALILSAWFTRGWTAAELFVSHTVKILFKDPHGDEPLIKDLDDDVLSWDADAPNLWDRLAHFGHYNASRIVGILRTARSRQLQRSRLDPEDEDADPPRVTTQLKDLMEILGARSTSWARDKMIIAGLMVLDNYDSSISEPASMTKRILSTISGLHCRALFHVMVPMCSVGPWSWCPPSLFDLGTIPSQMTSGRLQHLDPPQDGSVRGIFSFQCLTRHDRNCIVPHSSHPAMRTHISHVLTRWENCLLLADESSGYKEPGLLPVYLLATTVGTGSAELSIPPPCDVVEVVECRYVGTVVFPPERFDSKVGGYRWWCRFGKDLGRSECEAKPIVDELRRIQPHREWLSFLDFQ